MAADDAFNFIEGSNFHDISFYIHNFQKATFDKLSKVQKLHNILQSFPSRVQSLSRIQTCALASLHCTKCVRSRTAKWTGYGKMLPHFRVNNVLLQTLLLPIHSYPLPLLPSPSPSLTLNPSRGILLMTL